MYLDKIHSINMVALSWITEFNTLAKILEGNIDMMLWQFQKNEEKAMVHTYEAKMPNSHGRW